MAKKGALATLDDEAAITELASGTFLQQIADRYQVGKAALRERLMQHPSYKAAVTAQAEAIVEQATAHAMSEELPVLMPHIARARLRVETAHKWAAARDPKNWSTKVDVTSAGESIQGDPQTILIDAARALLFVMEQSKVIEGEVIHNDAVQQQEGEAQIIEDLSSQAIDKP